jgi:hypothetical protein
MVLARDIRPGHSSFFFRIMSSLVVIGLLLLGGCQPDIPLPKASVTNDIQTMESNGFTIPVFPTAAEQLGYARTRIANAKEEQATLELVLTRFPQDTFFGALSRLDLAYLTLGTDYRLADPNTCRRALSHYRQITRTYADLPGVCAKAYWYMGWIYTDLLGEKKRGAAMYQQVIDRYAGKWVTIESTGSRFMRMVPERRRKAMTTHDRQNVSWVDLALLEVVKNNPDPIHQQQALKKLWSRKSTGPAIGLALLSALKSSRLHMNDTIARMAREYIQQHANQKVLTRDIEQILAQCKPMDKKK